MMAFDECIPYPCDKNYAEQSTKKTIRWLKECRKAWTNPEQALFGIVQGSVYEELRVMCAKEMGKLDLPGYAIGGVSVGEGLELLKKVVGWTAPHLPESKPRYLMGVGLPEDILESVERGMDMFDCVIPTRYARSATLFTRRGKIRVSNKNYKRDFFRWILPAAATPARTSAGPICTIFLPPTRFSQRCCQPFTTYISIWS